MWRHKSIQVLPEELLVEILSRLPFKSLTTCKCVSILWRKLSNSLTFKTFIRTHNSASNSNNPSNEHHSLFQREYPHAPELWLDWHLLCIDLYDNPRKLGRCVYLPICFGNFTNSTNICNGLVCFFKEWTLPYASPTLVYSVTTHDFVTLPTSNKPFPWKHNLCCFLGFEPVKGEYIVLRTITNESLVSSYQVISIGSKSWKEIDVPYILSRGGPCRNTSGICVNGVIYWIHDNHMSRKTDYWKILYIAAFDLGRKEFRVFNMDELVGCSYENHYSYYLTSLKGCPTLFFWKSFFDDAVLQLTLSDHHANANCASWGRSWIPMSSVTSDWFRPSISIYVGSSIFVHSASEDDSRYLCYNYENGTSWVTTVDNLRQSTASI